MCTEKERAERVARLKDSLEAVKELYEIVQQLDAKLDPDGLDKSGQEAWGEYESEEEFGEPNAAYCQSEEVDHNGGWFCYHPNCVTSPEED